MKKSAFFVKIHGHRPMGPCPGPWVQGPGPGPGPGPGGPWALGPKVQVRGPMDPL